MSILADLLSELLGGAIGPSTDRGLVATFTCGSIALLSISGWLLMTSPDPLKQPAWGINVYIGSILAGAVGAFVSALHLRRNPSDGVFALACLAGNGAAVAFPAVYFFLR